MPMTPIQPLPQPLPLPVIHARWTLALSLPPTAQISNLRRLVRAVTQDRHPALRSLTLAYLYQLYLDLALAYAFLGEYYLASKVFKEVVDNDPTCAVAWFGLGLAQAELAEWRNARRSWNRCLGCFEPIGGQWDGIPYPLFRTQDERSSKVRLDSRGWVLERTRVQFNLNVALRETGSKKLNIPPRDAGQKRSGLNGIPAELRFGPGWGAALQSLHTPPLLQYPDTRTEEPGEGARFNADAQPAIRTPSSSSSSLPSTLPSRISSRKPLLKIRCSPPTPIPSPADEGRFGDHTLSPGENPPTTSSPANDMVDRFANSTQTPTAPPREEYNQRFSRQSTLFTPEDQCFYDHSEEDGNDDPFDAGTAIASWTALDQTQVDCVDDDDDDATLGEEEEADEDGDDEQREEWEEGEAEPSRPHPTHAPTPTLTIDDDDDDDGNGEILQPRVFEGFGPPSQEEQQYVKFQYSTLPTKHTKKSPSPFSLALYLSISPSPSPPY